MTDQPAPTYLDRVRDLSEREADANALEGYRQTVARLERELEAAELREQAALACADRAEARVDQLTDQLNLANDTLRHRGEAVNATGASNDRLREEKRQLKADVARYHRAFIVANEACTIREGALEEAGRRIARVKEIADEWGSNLAPTIEARWGREACITIRAALADQEPAK